MVIMKSKNIFYLILMSVSLLLTSCKKTNDDPASLPPTPISLVGTWCETEHMEEIRFSQGNTFYFKFCFPQRAYEGEGFYEIDSENKRLTLTYKYMGQNQYLDWKILKCDDYGFDSSSESEGTHHYYKVVDTFTFKEGFSVFSNKNNTLDITTSTNLPSAPILSYKSYNENIAKVSSDGKITSTGEKGTTYIKVETSEGSVLVKVVVGNERYDMWTDYSVLLGKDVSQMRNLLGSPSETVEDAYGYDLHLIHDVIDYISIYLDTNTKKIDFIEIYFFDNIPSADILSYMKSKYYFYKNKVDQQWYMTSPTIDESRAVYVYFKEDNVVAITSAAQFKNSNISNFIGSDLQDSDIIQWLNRPTGLISFSH